MAVKKFGAAIAALPADVRLYVARGESQCALGAHRRAVYDFSMAIRLEPEVAAHHARARPRVRQARPADVAPGRAARL